MKEIKIDIPEGYVIDKENSTFECIKFKPKELTYGEVAKELFEEKLVWYAGTFGWVSSMIMGDRYADPNNSVSKKQVEKLLALNKLINVAKYLNGDWEPNFNNNQRKHAILNCNDTLITTYMYTDHGLPCFKTKELAEQAIEILGKETTKLAVSYV